MGTTTAFFQTQAHELLTCHSASICNHGIRNLKQAEQLGRKSRSDLTINREETSIK
jgi:hypothetical protein